MSSTSKPKLWRLLAALYALALVAAACSSDEPAETTTTDDTAETTAGGETTETTADEGSSEGDAISIAIVAPSAADDLAFTQSMVDAVNSLDENIDLQITDSTFVVEEAAAAIRAYAEAGVDIVIAHGTQFGGSLEEIAPEFPEITFAWGTSTETFGLANVFAYYPAADEGGYVLGTVAAALSESSRIGVVGPIEAGDAKGYIDGFNNGAKDAGAAEVSIVYTGSFGDVALAKEAAEAHLASGADVLTGSAQMVVGAIQVAAQNGIPWFGTQANQSELAPSLVVASQVYHWEVILEQILAKRAEGILGGEAYEINLANGGLVLEFNDGYPLDAGIREAADMMIAAIADGTQSTGV